MADEQNFLERFLSGIGKAIAPPVGYPTIKPVEVPGTAGATYQQPGIPGMPTGLPQESFIDRLLPLMGAIGGAFGTPSAGGAGPIIGNALGGFVRGRMAEKQLAQKEYAPYLHAQYQQQLASQAAATQLKAKQDANIKEGDALQAFYEKQPDSPEKTIGLARAAFLKGGGPALDASKLYPNPKQIPPEQIAHWERQDLATADWHNQRLTLDKQRARDMSFWRQSKLDADTEKWGQKLDFDYDKLNQAGEHAQDVLDLNKEKLGTLRDRYNDLKEQAKSKQGLEAEKFEEKAREAAEKLAVAEKEGDRRYKIALDRVDVAKGGLDVSRQRAADAKDAYLGRQRTADERTGIMGGNLALGERRETAREGEAGAKLAQGERKLGQGDRRLDLGERTEKAKETQADKVNNIRQFIADTQRTSVEGHLALGNRGLDQKAKLASDAIEARHEDLNTKLAQNDKQFAQSFDLKNRHEQHTIDRDEEKSAFLQKKLDSTLASRDATRGETRRWHDIQAKKTQDQLEQTNRRIDDARTKQQENYLLGINKLAEVKAARAGKPVKVEVKLARSGYPRALSVNGVEMSYDKLMDPGQPEEYAKLYNAAEEAQSKKMGEPTALTRTMWDAATPVIGFVDRLDKRIAEISDALGPVEGRWNEFMTGKLGTEFPQFEGFRAESKLLATWLMRMHSGRSSEFMLKEFNDLFANANQSPENMKEALNVTRDYANRLLEDKSQRIGQLAGKPTPMASPTPIAGPAQNLSGGAWYAPIDATPTVTQ